MDTSQLLAKYLGPVMLVAGLAFFINRQHLRAIFDDFLKSPALIFIAGFMALALGLTFVIFHNRWVADWPVIITIYGWLALVGGVMRIAFPQVAIKMGRAMIDRQALIMTSGVFNVLLGAFLTYMGYLA